MKTKFEATKPVGIALKFKPDNANRWIVRGHAWQAPCAYCAQVVDEPIHFVTSLDEAKKFLLASLDGYGD